MGKIHGGQLFGRALVRSEQTEQERQVECQRGEQDDRQQDAEEDDVDFHVIHSARPHGIELTGEPVEEVGTEVESRVPKSVSFILEHHVGLLS